MDLGLIGRAVGMFAVTNVDDIVLLALFFGRAAGHRGGAVRIFAGQYLGFAAILAASIVGALGAGLLPATVIPYLGLLPLALGIRAAWRAWRERHDTATNTANDTDADAADDRDETDAVGGLGVFAVAAVTLANGGDNIGVYVPVFASTGTGGLIVFTVVFLALVALWCLLGQVVAAHPLVARALARWGHILLPAVLIGIGLLILIEGGAFGL